MQEEGAVHHGITLQFDGRRRRIDLSDLTGGRAITLYGQHEVVKDLVHARLEAGGQLLFEAEGTGVRGADSGEPTIRYRKEGEDQELRCDFAVGCDRSEEHTSEFQSRQYLVCRLLLEKKKKNDKWRN